KWTQTDGYAQGWQGLEARLMPGGTSYDGMPGGPSISMPYSAARAVSRSRSGGSVGGGGMVRVGAGSLAARMNVSKPAGSVTSRKRASSETTSNVWGMSRGP